MKYYITELRLCRKIQAGNPGSVKSMTGIIKTTTNACYKGGINKNFQYKITRAQKS
jgi:hypothetical protein